MFFSDNIWRIGKKSIYLHPSMNENIENYVIPMNQRFLILLMVLMSSLRVWADNTVVLHGDVTHDGAITALNFDAIQGRRIIDQRDQESFSLVYLTPFPHLI